MFKLDSTEAQQLPASWHVMTNSPPRRDVVYAPVDHTCKDNNQQFIPDPSTTNLPAICQVLQTALTYWNNLLIKHFSFFDVRCSDNVGKMFDTEIQTRKIKTSSHLNISTQIQVCQIFTSELHLTTRQWHYCLTLFLASFQNNQGKLAPTPTR